MSNDSHRYHVIEFKEKLEVAVVSARWRVDNSTKLYKFPPARLAEDPKLFEYHANPEGWIEYSARKIASQFSGPWTPRLG